jgi:hypothetical protein
VQRLVRARRLLGTLERTTGLVGFYYISPFSIVPLAIAYAVMALVFSGIVAASRGIPYRKAVLFLAAAALLFVPVSDELWIALRYGQACKEAGTFIYKTAQVDGYYNDTGVITRIVGGPPYSYIESRDDNGGFRRVERASEDEKAQTLDLLKTAPTQLQINHDWVTRAVGRRTSVTVEMNTGYAWKITKLDAPNSRYYYTSRSHTPYSYKIVEHEDLITDRETKTVVARERTFGRYAPWFFIGLDAPVMLCRGVRNVKGTLYENTLLPKPR